jgi:hypothetical protein
MIDTKEEPIMTSELARALSARRKKGPKVCAKCGKEFVGFTKSKYCSRACVSVAYWDRNREQLNQKRRERYQRQKAEKVAISAN